MRWREFEERERWERREKGELSVALVENMEKGTPREKEKRGTGRCVGGKYGKGNAERDGKRESRALHIVELEKKERQMRLKRRKRSVA